MVIVFFFSRVNFLQPPLSPSPLIHFFIFWLKDHRHHHFFLSFLSWRPSTAHHHLHHFTFFVESNTICSFSFPLREDHHLHSTTILSSPFSAHLLFLMLLALFLLVVIVPLLLLLWLFSWASRCCSFFLFGSLLLCGCLPRTN